jgi:hypothetical protein
MAENKSIHEFTPAEIETINALKEVTNGTIWGSAIHNFLHSDFSRSDFWILIRDLRSQNMDSPSVMQEILGPAYPKVITL